MGLIQYSIGLTIHQNWIGKYKALVRLCCKCIIAAGLFESRMNRLTSSLDWAKHAKTLRVFRNIILYPHVDPQLIQTSISALKEKIASSLTYKPTVDKSTQVL